MLQITELHKTYGTRVLFDDVALCMEAGERLGLVGRNGHGKSTLFKIILGEEHPDAGSVIVPKNYRIGHLAQHLHFTESTILAEACLGLPPGESDSTYKAERILFGLGFSKEDVQRAPGEFSGGFQIRLNLVKVLLSEPNLLLLDEPTNYLDIVSLRWLTDFLRSWPGEMILISHDRDFLDGVTTHTAGIHRCQLKRIRGGTRKLYEQILAEEEIHEKTRLNQDKKREQVEAFINRFRAKATKAAAVQSRVKMLEKMGGLERLDDVQSLDFAFAFAPFEAKTVLSAQGLDFAYEDSSPLIHDFNLTVAARDRIGIIGKNGKGKSTLLNLLASELTLQRGEIKSHPLGKTGFFGQTNISRLDPGLTIEEEIFGANPELTRTRVRGICGLMMFSGDDAEKKISVLSGGEKSRVLLGKILAAPANLLLLDEPTNHLDMESIDALLDSIDHFPGAIIIVTHSEMILRRVATRLVVFHSGGHEVFAGGYDDFLERVGWESEEESSGQGQKKSRNKKEERRLRAEMVAERSRVLGPLKKEMDTIEKKIIAIEDALLGLNRDLETAIEVSDNAAIVRISRDIGIAQNDIEACFERLAEVTARYDEAAREFESAGE